MTDERKNLATRNRTPMSVPQQFAVLVSTSGLLLACFVPLHMNLAGKHMSPLQTGMLIVGDTGLIGIQLAAFLALFVRWRRTRKEAAGAQ